MSLMIIVNQRVKRKWRR